MRRISLQIDDLELGELERGEKRQCAPDEVPGLAIEEEERTDGFVISV